MTGLLILTKGTIVVRLISVHYLKALTTNVGLGGQGKMDGVHRDPEILARMKTDWIRELTRGEVVTGDGFACQLHFLLSPTAPSTKTHVSGAMAYTTSVNHTLSAPLFPEYHLPSPPVPHNLNDYIRNFAHYSVPIILRSLQRPYGRHKKFPIQRARILGDGHWFRAVSKVERCTISIVRILVSASG